MTVLLLVGGVLTAIGRMCYLIYDEAREKDSAAYLQVADQQSAALQAMQEDAERLAEQQLGSELHGVAGLLSRLGPVPLLTMDFETLNEYCASVCENPDVLLAVYVDSYGEIVTDFRNADSEAVRDLVGDVGDRDVEGVIEALREHQEDVAEVEIAVTQDNTDIGKVLAFGSRRGVLAQRAAIGRRTSEMRHILANELTNAERRQASLLARAYDSIVRYGVFAAMLATVCGLFAAYHISSWYGKPITEAVSVLEAVASGDLSRRMSDYDADEFSRISVALNDAIVAQSKGLADLQQASERERKQSEELKHVIERQIHTERKLRSAKQAAEEASSAKSQFLANMSHEIRTPLNAILGYAAILLEDRAEDDHKRRREHVGAIHRSGEHLLHLIGDILDLSKIEAGEMNVESLECSPHQIVADVISLVRVKAKQKGLYLRCAWPDKIPKTIRTDPHRLRQAVMNLAENAVKFTATGGVTIAAQMKDVEGDDKLMIRVMDTGVGIAAEKADHIFDPFVQADSSVTRKFGGTGLGLAISRHIARSLGGDLTVRSEEGIGSTFCLTVATGPLDGVEMVAPSEADALIKRERQKAAAAKVLPPIDVLLVEDGETNRRLITLMLRRGGANVTTAENGLEGVELAMGGDFDVVLMDMQMPVMDGYTATRRLRQNGVELPIIALTAHAMAGDADKCLAAGCSDYLTKPVDPSTLIATIVKHLDAEKVRAPLSPTSEPRIEENVGQILDSDDEEFVEIAKEFLESLPNRLTVIAEARTSGDLETLGMQAHRLKSASGMIGFQQLSETSGRLERKVKEHEPEESLLAEIQKISAMVDSIRAAAPTFGESREETPEEAPPSEPRDDRPLIMIIDDEPINFQVIRNDLKKAGFQHFVTVSDPRDGLRLIEELRPDLILLDLLMPEVSGLDVLRQLHVNPELRHIPILMLTASGDPKSKRSALELGATDFLTKPIASEDLVPRVKNSLRMKSQHDALVDSSERLAEKVRSRTADLAASRLELIHCLARAAECRDNETGRHVIRVGRICGVIARRLGLSPETAELIEHAAPLHDVGKIGIPDRILLSPDRLSDEDFEIMKGHCEIGGRTFEPLSEDEWISLRSHTFLGENIREASRSPIIEMAANIAMTHHEKWDGSGYPQGLAAEEIPIEGRITAVADVFDALSSERPYKDAYSLKKCYEILEQGRNAHFDPDVLDAFFESIDEILEIRRKFAEGEDSETREEDEKGSKNNVFSSF